jgi:hypothetical protein
MNIVMAVLVLLVVAAFGAWIAGTYRKGGSGPPIVFDPLTKKGRARANATWAGRGWKKPYDQDGHPLPWSQRGR